MRVLGLILARGGSKGVPGKNVRLLHGKPLLAYTAEPALEATRLARVVLSTDDPVIADIGRQHGLEVPFMRPAELAGDDTPSLPVVQHALRTLAERADRYDAVCLLQPTNPLRRASDIDHCVKLLEHSGADCVMTVLRVPDEHNPAWVYFRRVDGSLALCLGGRTPPPRRQLLTPAYHRDGSVYVTRADLVLRRGTLYGRRVLGCEMDPAWHVNIDTPSDWTRAEALIARRKFHVARGA